MARRPLNTLPPISCDDACHKSRGSAGGTDYAVPVGTHVFAPFTGFATVTKGNGTAGWFLTIHNAQNHTCHLDHLSGFEVKTGHVDQGDLVALSGGAVGSPGAGSATGPHLHADVDVPGKGRMGMEEYLHEFGGGFAGGGTPINDQEGTMYLLQINKKDDPNEPKYTFDGHTMIPVPYQTGNQFETALGTNFQKISRSTFDVLTAQGKAHMAAEAGSPTRPLGALDLELTVKGTATPA